MSLDIVTELRSWCVKHHLPSGASECLFCEAAMTIELHQEELFQLARLATAGWVGEVSGSDRDVQMHVSELAYRHRQDALGARLNSLITWPIVHVEEAIMTWYNDTPHTAMLQAGSDLCICGSPKSDPVHWVPKCTADRRCMSVEHDRNCPQAIAKLASEDRMRQARKLVEKNTTAHLSGVAAASARTVRDDYPALTVLADAAAHLDDAGCPEAVRAWREVARLRQWKAEAITVLDEWEAVWEAAGKPGQPGVSKARQVRRLIEEWSL